MLCFLKKVARLRPVEGQKAPDRNFAGFAGKAVPAVFVSFTLFVLLSFCISPACRYVIGKAVFNLIPGIKATETEPNDRLYFYLHDHLGGIDAVVDENGDVVERKDYLPYGKERLTVDDTNEDYGFTGKELDEETGLYYYGARYYDPLIGRFISLDPLILWESSKPFGSVLSNPQAFNGYSYVLNNPLRYIDPTGMFNVKTGEVEKGDNLTNIAKEINKTYETKLTVNDIVRANNIKDANKVYIGDRIKLPRQDLELKFDNKYLQGYDKAYGIGYEDLKWRGVSGGTIFNFDPISEGTWRADPKNTQYYSALSESQKFLGEIKNWLGFRFGTWPGGQESWGSARTELDNMDMGEKNTGYFIHGGPTPGSMGCIDLTEDNDSFHAWFTKIWSKPIDLQIKY